MRTLHKFGMMCVLVLGITACANDVDDLQQNKITLTTPVLTIEGVKATMSRGNGNTLVPTNMKLQVELLDQRGNSTSRNAVYTYNTEGWNCNSPLVVTGGAGSYFASAVASEVEVNNIHDCFYAYQVENNEIGTINVSDEGTFTFGSALIPLTAAIKVNLTDADNKSVNSGATVYLNICKATDVSLNGTLNYESTPTELNSFEYVFGHYKPTEFNEGAQIMTISYNGVNYNVSTGDQFKIEAGKIYTLNVRLSGNSEIKINDSDGVTVGGFTDFDTAIEIK